MPNIIIIIKKEFFMVPRDRAGFLALAALSLSIATPSTAAAQAKFHYRQGGQLEGVFFLNSQKGWTAEDGGRLRFSQDGGLTWAPAEVPDKVRGELRGVFMRSNLEGWAVGDGGVVLKTEDQEGDLWT